MTVYLDQFLAELVDGDYDDRLTEIIELAKKRQRTAQMSHTKEDFSVGDKIIFNDYCGTKYMRGRTGTVISKKQKKLVVVLDKPVGRFAIRTASGEIRSAEITVPPQIVDRV